MTRLKRTWIVMAILSLVLVAGCATTDERWTLETHGYSSNFSLELLRLSNYRRTIHHDDSPDGSTEIGRWRSATALDVDTEQERVILVLRPRGSEYDFLLFMDDQASSRFEHRISDLDDKRTWSVKYSSDSFILKLLDGPKRVE